MQWVKLFNLPYGATIGIPYVTPNTLLTNIIKDLRAMNTVSQHSKQVRYDQKEHRDVSHKQYNLAEDNSLQQRQQHSEILERYQDVE